MTVTYQLHDVVTMKKTHACGENCWQIIRLGMDIRIKCQKCGHAVLLPRARFDHLVRKVILSTAAAKNEKDSHQA